MGRRIRHRRVARAVGELVEHAGALDDVVRAVQPLAIPAVREHGDRLRGHREEAAERGDVEGLLGRPDDVTARGARMRSLLYEYRGPDAPKQQSKRLLFTIDNLIQ